MTRRVGLLVYPDFQSLDLAGLTVFELANSLFDEPAYRIDMLSEHGGPVVSSGGIRVDTDPFDDPAFDTLLLTGTMKLAPSPQSRLDFIRQASAASRRTASICTGAFILAEAGLLNGRRATTHWAHARELQRRFPRAEIDENRIYVADGGVWTSAGMSACIDLALALVEDDFGADVAQTIARNMVVYHRRAGGQSQFSALLELQPKSDRVQAALSFARANLKDTLSVEQLADVAGIGMRQFSRVFRTETGQSPAKAVENLRVEAARIMVESSTLQIDVIAAEAGFSDPDRMRRAFLRAFGQPPQAIKRAVHQHGAIENLRSAASRLGGAQSMSLTPSSHPRPPATRERKVVGRTQLMATA